MPFKTKKRKLKAVNRRFVFGEGSISIVDKGGTDSNNLVEEKKQDFSRVENLLYIRRDLIKIIVLSVSLVGAQILLRLTLIK